MSFDIRTIRPSHYVIAAICGNWWWESAGINPGAWESFIPCPWDYMHTQSPPAGGFGLGQWTNTASYNMRCLNLHNYVVNHGYQDGQADGQLMFFGEEDIWNLTSPRLGIPNLKAFLESPSTDLESLCFDFLICWEGINDGTFPQRYGKAQQFLTYIQQHANDNPADYSTCISANRALSDSETLHNLMYIYFALNGYLGSPALTTEQLMVLISASRKRGNNIGKSWIQS